MRNKFYKVVSRHYHDLLAETEVYKFEDNGEDYASKIRDSLESASYHVITIKEVSKEEALTTVLRVYAKDIAKDPSTKDRLVSWINN